MCTYWNGAFKNNNYDFKQKIYQYYLQLVQDRIDVFRWLPRSRRTLNDAKGSAGDKHETALSMMHIEQEKLNYKLREVVTQKQSWIKLTL
jgi:hypothetical protein